MGLKKTMHTLCTVYMDSGMHGNHNCIDRMW